MSFNEYLRESLSEEAPFKASINSIVVQDLIDIMNNFKDSEYKSEEGNRKKFPLMYADEKEISFPKIDRVINELGKYSNLKGREALRKLLEILRENGIFQDSKPVIDLMKKYGSEVLDLYISTSKDEDIPAFLKK